MCYFSLLERMLVINYNCMPFFVCKSYMFTAGYVQKVQVYPDSAIVGYVQII